MPWKLTVRAGPRVERTAVNDLASALDALESRARELDYGKVNCKR